VLSTFLMALAGAAVLAGLAALWQSLRTTFGGGPASLSGVDVGLPARQALLAEKTTLLRTIKDIAFERELGKISDDDFARLDRAYRGRAKRVLSLLDEDIEPFLAKAERAVAEAMGEVGEGDAGERGRRRAKRAKGARGAKRKRKRQRRQPSAAPSLSCHSCGVPNDVDAAYCKGCAARLSPLDCPRCETRNDADARYCKSCAEPLAVAPAPAPPPERIEEEE